MGTRFAASKRIIGAEFRMLRWMCRHPGSLVLPAAATAGGLELGWEQTGTLAGVGAGVAALAATAWYRGHPDSFDGLAAPQLRAFYRRWSSYLGPRWRDALLDCELVTTHRKTQEIRCPRIIKVAAPTPSIDVLHVRIAPGQHIKAFENKLGELADALGVQRIGVERIRPRVLGLVIERSEPFTETIDAPELTFDVDEVDLDHVFLGETEYGGDWVERLTANHLFVAGAMGSGKNSITWEALRTLAPLIRDGLVRLWICDPKRVEMAKAAPIAHRYAAEPTDCLAVVEEFVTNLESNQRELAKNKRRKFTPSRETPLDLLIMDELGTLTAYGDHARSYRKLLSIIGSQGRATGDLMWGFVQEPTKDTVPVRDLFTLRVCLRVTSASHVDMVLGDNARLRGALADEIPNIPETAGIGYVVRQRSRLPIRVRAAYVTDDEIDELIAFVLPELAARTPNPVA